MTIVVIGSDGQLGSELTRHFGSGPAGGVIALTHRDIEISDIRSVEGALKKTLRASQGEPFVVVNTAAYNLVDDCEHSVEKAFAVNAKGPENLSKATAALGAVLVHFTTDYVFDGTKGKPYAEGDRPNPISVYGASKLAGEEAVRSANSRHYLLRTSGLYGHAPSRGRGENFVELMLRLAVERSVPLRGGGPQWIEAVADQHLAPTYTRSIVRQLEKILGGESGRTVGGAPFGLYHVVNGGGCSWFEFAQAIFSKTHMKVDLRPIPAAKLSRSARRPAYCVLENAALRRLGIDVMEPWQEALQRYLFARNQLSAMSFG